MDMAARQEASQLALSRLSTRPVRKTHPAHPHLGKTLNPSIPRFSSFFIIETTYDYQAFAYGFPSVGDGTYAKGYAQEGRYRKVWGPGGEKGLALEQESVEQSNAIDKCFSRAWEEACSGRQIGSLIPESKSTSDTDKDDRADPHRFPSLPFVESLAEMITAMATRDPEPR